MIRPNKCLSTLSMYGRRAREPVLRATLGGAIIHASKTCAATYLLKIAELKMDRSVYTELDTSDDIDLRLLYTFLEQLLYLIWPLWVSI